MKDQVSIKSFFILVLILLPLIIPILPNKSSVLSDTEIQEQNIDNEFDQSQKMEIEHKQRISSQCPRTGEIEIAVLFMSFVTQGGGIPDYEYEPSEIKTKYMDQIVNYWRWVTSGLIDLQPKYTEDETNHPASWFYVNEVEVSELDDLSGVQKFVNEAMADSQDRFPSGFHNYDMIFIWIYATLGNIPTIYTDDPCKTVELIPPSGPDSIQPMIGIAPVGPEDNPDYPEEIYWSNGAHVIGHNFGLNHTHDEYYLRSRYELMANG
ncbi:MAG: hypothetical protein ACFFAJ_13070, partial [Candidatus Hodarchaeota archaeon]